MTMMMMTTMTTTTKMLDFKIKNCRQKQKSRCFFFGGGGGDRELQLFFMLCYVVLFCLMLFYMLCLVNFNTINKNYKILEQYFMKPNLTQEAIDLKIIVFLFYFERKLTISLALWTIYLKNSFFNKSSWSQLFMCIYPSTAHIHIYNYIYRRNVNIPFSST